MPSTAKLYITRWAFALIEREARSYVARSGAVENETGGILIGQRIDQERVVILAATGPGPRAEMQQFVFSPDISYSNNRLRDYHIAYPRADYLGTWHKHPSQYPGASAGDLATARAILRDRSYKLDELFCPIVWVHSGQIYLTCYYLDRAGLRARQPFQVIPSDQIELIDDLHPLRSIGPANTAALLKLRLSEERDLLLRAGYTVELRQDQEQPGFLMDVRGADLGERAIVFEIPTDYPRRTPTMIVEHPGREPQILSEQRLLRRWEHPALPSLLTLVEQEVNPARLEPEATGVIALPPKLSARSATNTTPPGSERPSFRVWPFVGLSIVVALLLAMVLLRDVGSIALSPRPTPSLSLPTATLSTDQSWERANATSDPAERVALIETLVRAGVTVDPVGVPVVRRLFDARILLGQALRDAGDYPESITALQAAGKSPPSDSARADVSRELAATYLAAAGAARATSNYADAFGYYQALLDLQPPAPAADQQRARDGQSAAEQERARLEEIRQLLQTYEQADTSSPPNWLVALNQLTTLETMVGLRPSPEQYPTAVYGDKLSRLPVLLIETRLGYAAALEREGLLDAADAQYAALLGDPQLREAVGDAALAEAQTKRNTLAQAKALWQEVNTSLERRGDLSPARIALVKLINLGFDPDSRNPRNRDQSISLLQQEVKATATPVPTRPPAATPRTLSTTATTTSATVTPATPTQAGTPTNTPGGTTPTETPLPTPAPVVYAVKVEAISTEQMAGYFPPNGLIPPNINAIIDGPPGLSMSISTASGATIAEFSSDARIIYLPLSQPAVIQVLSDSRGRATSQTTVNTYVQNQYYRIIVIRIS